MRRLLKTFSRRAVTSFLVLIALSLFVSTSQAQDKLSVRLAWTPMSNHVFFFLPAEKGWFKEAGLDVSIEDGNGSVQTIQMVGGGKYDIGEASTSAMILGRDKVGIPMKSIMIIVRKSDFGAMCPKKHNVMSLKDIEAKGLGLAFSPASMENPFMDTFLAAGGTSRKKLKLVAVEPSAKVSSYMSGKVDCMISSLPYFAPILSRKMPSTAIAFADVGLKIPSNGILARDDTIKEKASELRRFVSVMSRSMSYVLDGHEDEAIDAMIAQRPRAKIDHAFIREQLEAFRPFFVTDETKGKAMGWHGTGDWNAAIQLMQRVGALSKGLKPTDFYTNELFN